MTSRTTTTTVVVCAYTEDRWDDLVASVESVRGLPEAPEALLVIDHNDALLARSRDRWSDVIVVPNEFRQGLSGARNTGVKLASGDVVAFLDDDATAEPDWLTHLLAPFADPAVAGVGGHATPVWPEGATPSTPPSSSGSSGAVTAACRPTGPTSGT
nr:hypothetical protein GCM10025699_49040 [Microbacterium flavescens]